jgi:hypothetical protein
MTAMLVPGSRHLFLYGCFGILLTLIHPGFLALLSIVADAVQDIRLIRLLIE